MNNFDKIDYICRNFISVNDLFIDIKKIKGLNKTFKDENNLYINEYFRNAKVSLEKENLYIKNFNKYINNNFESDSKQDLYFMADIHATLNALMFLLVGSKAFKFNGKYLYVYFKTPNKFRYFNEKIKLNNVIVIPKLELNEDFKGRIVIGGDLINRGNENCEVCLIINYLFNKYKNKCPIDYIAGNHEITSITKHYYNSNFKIDYRQMNILNFNSKILRGLNKNGYLKFVKRYGNVIISHTLQDRLFILNIFNFLKKIENENIKNEFFEKLFKNFCINYNDIERLSYYLEENIELTQEFVDILIAFINNILSLSLIETIGNKFGQSAVVNCRNTDIIHNLFHKLNERVGVTLSSPIIPKTIINANNLRELIYTGINNGFNIIKTHDKYNFIIGHQPTADTELINNILPIKDRLHCNITFLQIINRELVSYLDMKNIKNCKTNNVVMCDINISSKNEYCYTTQAKILKISDHNFDVINMKYVPILFGNEQYKSLNSTIDYINNFLCKN